VVQYSRNLAYDTEVEADYQEAESKLFGTSDCVTEEEFAKYAKSNGSFTDGLKIIPKGFTQGKVYAST